MSEPLFDSSTPRFSFPLLFAGQAQKEGFINEVTARLDALLFADVEGVLAAPPAAAADGQSWIVGNDPTDAWTGRSGQIASRQAGNWLFTLPVFGMRVFDKSTAQNMYFRGDWVRATRPTAPVAGTTIDNESRAAISAIIAALVAAGIVSGT